MTFWFLVVALFASEAVYEFLPDAAQQQIEWSVVQWQLVILAAIGYAANTYENTYRKGAMLIATLWCLYIALTDWLLPSSPAWIGAAEGAFFLGWIGYACYRIKAVQSLPQARYVVRDAIDDADRKIGGQLDRQ